MGELDMRPGSSPAWRDHRYGGICPVQRWPGGGALRSAVAASYLLMCSVFGLCLTVWDSVAGVLGVSSC